MSIGQIKVNGVSTFSKITPVVQVKSSWSGSWQTVSKIIPQSLDTYACPAKDKASFVYHYGRIRHQEDSDFSSYYPLSLRGYYIRVLMLSGGQSQQVWVGTIVADGLDMHGSANGDSGDQMIEAMGLEHILDQMPCIGAVVNGDDLVGGSGQTIESMPTFNLPGNFGSSVLGNRTTTADATYGVHLFSSDGETWSNLDIVQYLLAFYQPSDFTVTLSGQYDLLGNITLIHKLEGRSLKSCFDQLIDRHRGLGWCLRYSGSNVYLHVFSTFGSPVAVGNGQTLSPNMEQFYLSLGNQLDVNKVIVRNVESQAFDAVNVLGDPIEVTNTFSFDDSSLAAGWTGAQQSNYLAATGSSDTSDPSLNDAVRRSDLYASVYQRYIVPTTWDGMGHSYDPGSGAVEYKALPTYGNGALDADTLAPLFITAARFLRHIPIALQNSAEYSPPLAFITYDGELFQVDAPPEDVPSATVRVLDDALGVHVRSSVPHVYGKNTFDTGSEASSNTDPIVDYQDLMVTASFKSDQVLSVWYRINSGSRTLLIRVPDAKLQYIVPGTITGVSGGVAVISAGGIVRDDTERLQLIAALAAAWYGQPRAAVTLKFKNAFKIAEIGQYIQSVKSGSQSQEVGTVVTRQSWSIQKQTISMTVDTSFYELDLSRIVEFPTIGGPRNLAGEIKTLQGDVLDLRQRAGNLIDRGSHGGGSVISGGAGGTFYTGYPAS